MNPEEPLGIPCGCSLCRRLPDYEAAVDALAEIVESYGSGDCEHPADECEFVRAKVVLDRVRGAA